MKLIAEIPVREVEFQSATSFGIGMGAHTSAVDGNESGAKIKGLKLTWTPAGLLWDRPTKTGLGTVTGLIPAPQCKSMIFYVEEADVPATNKKKAN